MDPRTERAILNITTDFRRPLSLQSLASQVGLSPFYFHRLFKTDTGETPADYLKRVRLEHAAHLLIMMPDASLLAIALESGFSSAAIFARAFKQQFRQPATAFRAANPLPCNESQTAESMVLQALPTRVLTVQRCALNEDALTQAYRQLAMASQSTSVSALGIFVDMPFHHTRQLCRHFLTLESATPGNPADSITLDGGVHVVVPLSGDLDAASETILRYHAKQIAPSPYAIASTLAFERIVIDTPFRKFDYQTSKRELFIKLRRKNEPVI